MLGTNLRRGKSLKDDYDVYDSYVLCQKLRTCGGLVSGYAGFLGQTDDVLVPSEKVGHGTCTCYQLGKSGTTHRRDSGSGLGTKESAHGSCLSVDTYSYHPYHSVQVSGSHDFVGTIPALRTMQPALQGDPHYLHMMETAV